MEAMGPAIRRNLPPSLVSTQERDQIVAAVRGSGLDWGYVIAIDSECGGCRNMISSLRRKGVPGGATLSALVQSEPASNFPSEVRSVASVFIDDTGGQRRTKAGIVATPYVMIVDGAGRVQYRVITSDLAFALTKWRQQAARSSKAEHQHTVEEDRQPEDEHPASANAEVGT
jgi:hypothetical protein